MLNEWVELKNLMWSDNGLIRPAKFVNSIQEIARKKNKDLFTGHAQNDMPEFLMFFIECLHNSISRSVEMKISGKTINEVDTIAKQCYTTLRNTYKKEYSEIMQMFYGIYYSEIRSIDDKIIHSVRPEQYFIVDLPITTIHNQVANNLYDCFNLYCEPELLENENAWYNEKTKKKENIKKQIKFFNFPQILIVILKRFSIDGTHRINNKIDIPIDNLDLSKYSNGYNNKQYKYDLFGICNHMGSLQGGHYTAYVKNFDNNWLSYDDNNVEEIKVNDIISPMAYCLFYRKKK
jgi:ubiquitin C-terminal hydrolase